MTLRKAFDGEVYYWYEDAKSRQVKSRVTAASVEAGRDVMTNEKEAAPSYIVVTELDTLITRLTDAAFDCGDYDDSKSDDGYKILFDAEQKAIDDLKTYVATVRAEVFKEAAEIVARLPVRINRSGVKKGSDLNGWASAINEAVKALEAAENRKEEG